MARSNKRQVVDLDDDSSSQGSVLPQRRVPAMHARGYQEPSPSASFYSDKENRISPTRRHSDKGKALMSAQEGPNKRRKLEGRIVLEPSQVAFQRVKDGVDNKAYYDPDQPMAERRAVRKGIRELAKELADSRNEFLGAKSDGLKATLEKANRLFANVKQTSDATLDSRLLVTAGDLTVRRAIQNKLGGVTTGIDVDEFVGKCMAFMRKGPTDREAAALSLGESQRQRRNVDRSFSDASEGEDEGDAYNWEWLGRKACFPYNTRPPIPGFLLGPLSVQKKVRKVTQRTQRQQKRNPADAVRPDEIKLTDIERAENANLTTLCRKIYDLLCTYQVPRSERAEAELEGRGEDITEEEAFEILARHGLRTNTGVCLFKFAFNPESFGQTVENLFYISFLVRDGVAGLGTDDHGLLTLHPAAASTPAQIRENKITKRQAVFHLDFQTWRDVVKEFEIDRCIIPHRDPDEGRQVGAKGWYG